MYTSKKARQRLDMAGLVVSLTGYGLACYLAADSWGWAGTWVVLLAACLGGCATWITVRPDVQELARLRHEIARINETLRLSGIEYPTGARGVEDLAQFAEWRNGD